MGEAEGLSAPKRGVLIVFEGIDRSGKSSQAKLLYERLLQDKIPTKFMRFPDRTTPTGQLLSNALAGNSQLPAQALHLLFAANRWEVQPQMIAWLNEGFVLVVDRYSFSGVAYSTTAANILAEKVAKADPKAAAARVPLSAAFAKVTEEGLPAPDRVFFLDITPEEAQNRQGFGGEVYETLELQKSIYEVYASFRSLPFWRVLSVAKAPTAEVHAAILKEVSHLFEKINAEKETTGRRLLWGE